MSKDGRVWLSHTGIELLERCPRCFWLYYKKGIKQPEGIQSRLANRFDQVIKNYFNKYRDTGILPPLIINDLSGYLQNPFQETYFYRIDNKYGFLGKLDECLITDGGLYTPIDFKTASSDPREKDILSAYQHQIDEYIFLLEENGKNTTKYGYLIFFYPDLCEAVHQGFPMIVKIHKVDAKYEDVKVRLHKAIDVLESDLPAPGVDCPFCSWITVARSYYVNI